MREEGLVCKVRAKKRYNSYRGTLSTIAPNVLRCDFGASGPNRQWVSDVSEFRVNHQKIYLSPVIDLYDHSVVAFSISSSPNLELLTSSLEQAFTRARPDPGLVVHTDQGFQYQHRAWKKILAVNGAEQSMSRKGNCYDNAMAENFFGHLKAELFYQRSFTSCEELATEIRSYINWYNTIRIQERLKGMTPNQYRNHALAA